jgi:hypothetical protein
MFTLFIGKFYLANAGYTCRPGFLPPYRGTRYNLQEYGEGITQLMLESCSI